MPTSVQAPMTSDAWAGPTQQEYREYRNPEIAKLFAERMIHRLFYFEDAQLCAGQAASRLAAAAGLSGGLAELLSLLEVQARANSRRRRREEDEAVPLRLLIVNLMEHTWCSYGDRADLAMATGLSKREWDEQIGQWS